MAKYGSPIDLQQMEIRNAAFQDLSSYPSSPAKGQFALINGVLEYWSGSAWIKAREGSIGPGAVGTGELADQSVTPAKMYVNSARLLGRIAAGQGAAEEITVTGGVELSGVTLRSSAYTGDVTKAAGGTATTIATAAVTLAKMANLGANTIIGRLSTTGVPQALTPAQTKTILAILASDISDFDGQVRSSRLDQMAAPTATVSMNNQRLTGLAAPTQGSDAVNRDYADAIAQGMSYKEPVRVVATTNLTLSGVQTVDGVSLVAGDRVLVTGQTTASANGIYVVAAGAWPRADDANAVGELKGGTTVYVNEGTSFGDSTFSITSPSGSVTPGSTAHTWSQTSGLGQITAGNGLVKTGNSLAVGAGAGITVGATSVSITDGGVTEAKLATNAINLSSATKVTGTLPVDHGGTGATTAVGARANLGAIGKYSENFGNGALQTFTIQHNLNTEDVTVSVRYASGTKEQMIVDWRVTDANNVRIDTGIVPASAELRVTITG